MGVHYDGDPFVCVSDSGFFNMGDVAQLVEHRLCKPGVTGSRPVISTRSYSEVIASIFDI